MKNIKKLHLLSIAMLMAALPITTHASDRLCSLGEPCQGTVVRFAANPNQDHICKATIEKGHKATIYSSWEQKLPTEDHYTVLVKDNFKPLSIDASAAEQSLEIFIPRYSGPFIINNTYLEWDAETDGFSVFECRPT